MTDTPTPDLDARTESVVRLIECKTHAHGSIEGIYDIRSMKPDDLALQRSRHNRELVYARDYDALLSRAEHAEADLIALKTEREQIVRAFDDVSPVDESEKPLVQHLKDELADFAMVIDHCSVIYDNASGGRISKPNTLPREVIAQMEERIEEQVREAVAEETEELRAAKDAAEGRLTALRRCSTREIVMDAADRKALGHNPSWIKAVDVEEALASAAPTTEPT